MRIPLFRHPSLYEYMRDEVSAEDRRRIIDHLTRCRRCAEEADLLGTMLTKLPPAVRPSEQLSPEYWQHFSSAVERRIRNDRPESERFPSAAMQWAAQFIALRRRSLAVAAPALALVAVSLFLWKWFSPLPAAPVQTPVIEKQAFVEPATDRVQQYFRKSKVLLVGLTNMKTGHAHDIDLSAEREASRELVQQARYLQRQPLDPRSAKLIGDVQKVFIQLANMKAAPEAPNIELVRGGIHRENLLYKIRMAENLFDSSVMAHVY